MKPNGAHHVLITGGAGFVGTNLADRLLSTGENVLVFDNLSRAGVEENLRWLEQRHGNLLRLEIADVRDGAAVGRAMEQASAAFHFAAQAAVTTSLVDPLGDFEVNARGTFNLLEAGRRHAVPVIFSSTNKVYGALEGLPLRRNGSRYEPCDAAIRRRGINERQPLSFHSPYGCSKGCADQYVLDYARSYRLPALVFRMSCIYGPHQFGTEDQGWLAHFLIRALEGRPITIYGDGKQVRDILFVEDLVEAFLLARQKVHALAGEAFNIGGGISSTISLVESLQLIEELHERAPRVEQATWRTGDQRYYVSDIDKFSAATGWLPRVKARDGIARLYEWLLETRTHPAMALTAH